MSEGAVTFDFAALVKQHQALARASDDLSPSMQIISQKLVLGVHDEWDSAGQGSWAPLAESTLARKGSDGGLRMLFETGEAYGSVSPGFGSDFATASSDDGKLVYHVSSEPRSKIPLRDPFVLHEEVIDAAAEEILTAITGGVR